MCHWQGVSSSIFRWFSFANVYSHWLHLLLLAKNTFLGWILWLWLLRRPKCSRQITTDWNGRNWKDNWNNPKTPSHSGCSPRLSLVFGVPTAWSQKSSRPQELQPRSQGPESPMTSSILYFFRGFCIVVPTHLCCGCLLLVGEKKNNFRTQLRKGRRKKCLFYGQAYCKGGGHPPLNWL